MRKNQLANKRAFTMLELLVVLVVSGILSAIAVGKIHTNDLKNAAQSVMNDINYFRYLALNDDVFEPNTDYFNTYYQIFFHCVASKKQKSGKYVCEKEQGYSIFSDRLGTNSSNPDLGELARDYLDSEKYIGARFSGISARDADYSQRANLSKSFNIKKIEIFYKNFTGKVRKTHRLMSNELGEIFASAFDKKNQVYKLTKSREPYIIRLALSDSISKDNSICIRVNEIGFTDIPASNASGQVVWTSANRGRLTYCHKLESN